MKTTLLLKQLLSKEYLQTAKGEWMVMSVAQGNLNFMKPDKEEAIKGLWSVQEGKMVC